LKSDQTLKIKIKKKKKRKAYAVKKKKKTELVAVLVALFENSRDGTEYCSLLFTIF
jgi:hypothetical protein